MESFLAAIEQARKSGLSESTIHRELLLAEAQTGRLADLERELPDLLLRGEDLEEVCEAFVAGCLMNYRLDDAAQMLTIWQADFPKSARPVFLQSRLAEHADELTDAVTGYRRTLELNPRHGPAAFSLGRVLEQQNDLPNALAAYSRSRPLLYHPEPALVAMARTLRLQGKLSDARQLLDEPGGVSGTRDEREIAWVLAGATRQDARTGRLVETAELDVALGHPEQAVELFREVLTVDPQRWKLRYRFALLLRKLGRDDEAEQELVRYQETSDAMVRCDSLLARVRKNPADVDARFQIGCEFLEHLSKPQGIVWLRTVLDYDPHHEGALRILQSCGVAVDREGKLP